MKKDYFAAALFWLVAGFLEITAGGAALPSVSPQASGILVGRLSGESPYERLMSVPVLYQNEANPWVQQLAMVGQLQLQYAYGSDASGANTARRIHRMNPLGETSKSAGSASA